jgi:hypothetical protein
MRRPTTRLLLLLLIGALAPVALTHPAAPVAAADPGTDSGSSVTKGGTGRFSDLQVTVDQTENLRNQVIHVSWTGARPTSLDGFRENYLQIMQCWGDESGPKREDCTFGAFFRDAPYGETARRTIADLGGQLVDPAETVAPGGLVPFVTVNGASYDNPRDMPFDEQSTNELDYGRTAGDGTGDEYFEVQTQREAPWLGCGVRQSDGTGRACWLVVVPRDDREVDGRSLETLGWSQLDTSPLSASNFANAISFRLRFDPLGVVCPMGATRQILGQEEIVEAVTRWQPALCGATHSIYNYSQVPDDFARTKLYSDQPWLSVISGPVPDAEKRDDRRLVYAPVTIEGIGIAVVIERVPLEGAPASVASRRGTRVLDLKLDQRLVAKLLTQSYASAVFGPNDHVAKNPRSLTDDPEFLQLNPEFKALAKGAPYAITNPSGRADWIHALWQWVALDKSARDFVAGKADPWGMKVNPYYKGMSLDRTDFPRSDPTCQTFPGSDTGQAPLCSLEHLAYAADLHAEARGAARGQTMAVQTWDGSTMPGKYKLDKPTPRGSRAILALVDTGTAARYQLPLARLANGAGEYVAPDPAGMTAGLLAMREAEPGVLEMDPQSAVSGAYPLTQVSYAVTAPDDLDQKAAAAYAGFLRYAVGPGQHPGYGAGDLAGGFLPLTPKLREQTLAAAKEIEAGPSASSSPSPSPSTPTQTPGTTPGGSTPPAVPGTGTTLPSAGPTALPTGVPGGGPSVPGSSPRARPTAPGGLQPAASVPTPGDSVGAARFVLAAALLLALLSGAARWWLPRLLVSSRRSD